MLGINIAKRAKLSILKNISGIIRPSRMTLLLGPPSSGKSTLLKALSGRLDTSLKVSGDITYNGYKLEEFVPQKTAGYVSQNDVHVGAMTVKETLEFSSRCQGVGAQHELLYNELTKREKAAGIHPDADVDLFMKAYSMEGGKSSGFLSDYIIKILWLDFCANTMVGDHMIRGISGGEMKRVTTGEVIVGPSKVLFMDEISNGLDSSTAYQTVKCLQQIAHYWDATILMSLLQPAPETFNLFDDIILLSEGHIVYHGPRDFVLEFFESCGFRCPERKSVADFLQEVTLHKDQAQYQAQYWADHTRPYRYVSLAEFANLFSRFHVGVCLNNELEASFDQRQDQGGALVFKKNVIPFSQLLVSSFAKEWLLMKRTLPVYVFKSVQVMLSAFIMSTLFFRKSMKTNTISDGIIYLGALLFALIANLFSGIAEIPLTIARLPVFYKHRDFLLYPTWIFTFPIFVLRIPLSVLESTIWVVITYYMIGFAPEASRFFKQLLVVFLIQQMAIGFYRAIAGISRTMTISNPGGSFLILFALHVGGFILRKGLIPTWWAWAYWASPVMYAFNALAVNEFFSPRWMNKTVEGGSLGVAILENFNLFPERKWYWIGVGALLCFVVVFNIIFTIALAYLKPFEKSQAVINEDLASNLEAINEKAKDPSMRMRLDTLNEAPSPALFASNANSAREMVVLEKSLNSSEHMELSEHRSRVVGLSHKGMVVPFSPLTVTFDNISYHIDMSSGKTEGRNLLLNDVSGAFCPGNLTAIMGESGAGKTTLLDVLAGRKTRGYIKGDIKISGYSKNQDTFARVSGYCEQSDIHSPNITVRESLIYSAYLRLPIEINNEEKMKFVNEVMELVELNTLKDAIVGLLGLSGLSVEQRKRLTIAVELVANPSIIFMDEPTSGLDARAAAIVMRTVRNIVNAGRTIVCTIHQPSIDIFEVFDALLLIKRGQVIYSGTLGRHSEKMIKYFEAIPGVAKIEKNCNPATWVLEITSNAAIEYQKIDFAEHYKSSYLYQSNRELVDELSKPTVGSQDLYFPSKYPLSLYGQFKSCLWKQWITYWRSPSYNLVRFLFTFLIALFVGSVFWMVGHKRDDAEEFRIVVGAMVTTIQFIGISNCSTVQPIVSTERSVFYRERGAGMYSALPYALAQVVVEIPYVFLQSLYYSVIIYSMLGYEWTTTKFLWFVFIGLFTFMYFTYYGMMIMSISPNPQVAAIIASFFYPIFALFSGFYIPKPVSFFS